VAFVERYGQRRRIYSTAQARQTVISIARRRRVLGQADPASIESAWLAFGAVIAIDTRGARAGRLGDADRDNGLVRR